MIKPTFIPKRFLQLIHYIVIDIVYASRWILLTTNLYQTICDASSAISRCVITIIAISYPNHTRVHNINTKRSVCFRPNPENEFTGSGRFEYAREDDCALSLFLSLSLCIQMARSSWDQWKEHNTLCVSRENVLLRIHHPLINAKNRIKWQRSDNERKWNWRLDALRLISLNRHRCNPMDIFGANVERRHR